MGCCRFLGGAFDFESLVQNLLEQLAKKEAIIVNVYDITNSSRPLVMYGPDDFSEATSSHVSSLDFGDPFRKHEMRCRYEDKILNFMRICSELPDNGSSSKQLWT